MLTVERQSESNKGVILLVYAISFVIILLAGAYILGGSSAQAEAASRWIPIAFGNQSEVNTSDCLSIEVRNGYYYCEVKS